MGYEIYLSAAVATLLAVTMIGVPIAWLAQPQDRRIIATAALLTLPVPFVIVLLNWWVSPWLVPWAPVWHGLIIGVYAPLTEEPAKWAVLLVPRVRRALRPDNAGLIALAVGLGFAISEFWAQAYHMVGMQYFADKRLVIALTYAFAWLLSVFIHGGLLLFFAARLASGRSVIPGALAAMGLHYAYNIANVQFGGDWAYLQPAWYIIGREIIIACLITLGVVIVRSLGPKFSELREHLLGKPFACLSCGVVYDRPWSPLNLGWVSYERCPHCRNWQWVRAKRQEQRAG